MLTYESDYRIIWLKKATSSMKHYFNLPQMTSKSRWSLVLKESVVGNSYFQLFGLSDGYVEGMCEVRFLEQ